MRCLEEYNRFKKYEVNCILLLTDKSIDVSVFPNIQFSVHFYDPGIKHNLALKHRELMAKEQGKFDYYLYMEDDILLTEEVFDFWITEQNSIEVSELTSTTNDWKDPSTWVPTGLFMNFQWKEGKWVMNPNKN